VIKLIILFFLLGFYNPTFSSTKEKIISQMKLTNILSFKFVQTIDEKKEEGYCIIKYPKKIYCEYDDSKKKIIVSDGKFLVIKNKNSKGQYIYPLKKTPLEFLLDKDYLISKIIYLKPKIINNKYINFKIFENNNEINIFFDKDTLNLTGWQTEDIYQNLSITFISSVKINQKIDDKVFILPNNN
jgi:outer membrane lipoprotein-sorting protein